MACVPAKLQRSSCTVCFAVAYKHRGPAKADAQASKGEGRIPGALACPDRGSVIAALADGCAAGLASLQGQVAVNLNSPQVSKLGSDTEFIPSSRGRCNGHNLGY